MKSVLEATVIAFPFSCLDLNQKGDDHNSVVCCKILSLYHSKLSLSLRIECYDAKKRKNMPIIVPTRIVQHFFISLVSFCAYRFAMLECKCKMVQQSCRYVHTNDNRMMYLRKCSVVQIFEHLIVLINGTQRIFGHSFM